MIERHIRRVIWMRPKIMNSQCVCYVSIALPDCLIHVIAGLHYPICCGIPGTIHGMVQLGHYLIHIGIHGTMIHGIMIHGITILGIRTTMAIGPDIRTPLS